MKRAAVLLLLGVLVAGCGERPVKVETTVSSSNIDSTGEIANSDYSEVEKADVIVESKYSDGTYSSNRCDIEILKCTVEQPQLTVSIHIKNKTRDELAVADVLGYEMTCSQDEFDLEGVCDTVLKRGDEATVECKYTLIADSEANPEITFRDSDVGDIVGRYEIELPETTKEEEKKPVKLKGDAGNAVKDTLQYAE